MRAGVVVSAGIHLGLLYLLVVGLPQAEPFRVEQSEAFDVELVPFAEIPATRLGTREAEVQEVASVIKTEQQDTSEGVLEGNADRELNEAPTEDPTNLDLEQTVAAPEASELGPDTEPVPAPSPKPEPAPPEDPQPSEAEQSPAPEAPVAEEPATAPVEAAKPVGTPPPDPPVPRAREEREIAAAAANFRQRHAREAERVDRPDPDAVSQAVNRQEESGGGTQSSANAPALGSQTGRRNVTLTQAEENYLRQKIHKKWSPPIGVKNADQLKVSMSFELNQDGTVAGDPQVINQGSSPSVTAIKAAAAAKRAILLGQPYRLPPEKFEAWRKVIVNFDPQDLL